MPRLLIDQSVHHILWNLFLAVIPVVLAFIAVTGIRSDMRARGRVRWALWVPVLLVWLAYLPNTAYLATEWRHYLRTMKWAGDALTLTGDADAKLALLGTTLFYGAYSGFGLLTFFLSIWPLDRLACRRLGRLALFFKVALFQLCALGVYLGLIVRLNSWDLAHPHGVSRVFRSIWEVLYHHPLRLAVIVGFGLTLWLMYVVFDIWMDGLALRMRPRKAGDAPRLETSADGS
jgi:uncharacterized membrane protein